MSGAYGRRKGHGWEVELSHVASDATGLDIRTGRYFGLTYGADLVTVTGYDGYGRPVTYSPDVLGWSIEAKNDKSRNIAGWLRQAKMQAAPGTVPVVLWKRRNYSPGKGSAFMYDVDAPRGWVEIPIDKWIAEYLTKETDDERGTHGRVVEEAPRGTVPLGDGPRAR